MNVFTVGKEFTDLASVKKEAFNNVATSHFVSNMPCRRTVFIFSDKCLDYYT